MHSIDKRTNMTILGTLISTLALKAFQIFHWLSVITFIYLFIYLSPPCRAKVTKLDRDPASGTALQEISFWLNLERALNRIQEKRESPEVLLTLDILKHGKRFHATVSFDTDTGETPAIYIFQLLIFYHYF